MQQHVGKRRRKEVREAIDLHDELKSTFITTGVALFVGMGIAGGIELLAIFGVFMMDDGVVRFVPIAIIFVVFVLVGSRAFKITGLREEYKDHCRRYNITKDDMRALRRGEL